VIKRNFLPPEDVGNLVLKARAVTEYMDGIAQQLPSTAVARFYAGLCGYFVKKLENISGMSAAHRKCEDPNIEVPELWREGEEGWLNIDLGVFPDSLSLEQLVNDMGDGSSQRTFDTSLLL
jgi:hypothetical protein